MDLATKSNFLRDKGILTHISTSQRGANASNGLWVVLDDQYVDALECLRNPDHQVENLLDEDRMQEIEAISSQQYEDSINNFLVKAFLSVLVVIFILTIIFVRTSNT